MVDVDVCVSSRLKEKTAWVVKNGFRLSLSTLVLNSRDQYEKNGYQILHASKHILQKAILEKS